MHRDISPDNIIMVWNKADRRWKGLLIDWDHCIRLDPSRELTASRRSCVVCFVTRFFDVLLILSMYRASGSFSHVRLPCV